MKTLALLVAAAAWLCAQTGDPAAPGSLPVTNTFYKIEKVQVPSVPYPVDIWATVWHPDGLPGGPYPLVLFLHGNHGICRLPGTQMDFGTPLAPPACAPPLEPTPNHTGYDYIASLVASHGYIVVSINANAINVRANGNPERGRLVQEHLRYWALWNRDQGGAPFGRQFAGKVNLNSIGLIGHSRGGEGVRAAYQFNRGEKSPFGIRAILEIGPVDFGRIVGSTTPNPVFNVDNTQWSVLLPACDADVADNQGMRVFDRARVMKEQRNPGPKSQLYILGANHNFFNAEWLPEDPGFQCIDFPIITDRPQQEQIALTYVTGFVRAYLGGEDFRYLFTGDQRQPQQIRVPVAHSYTESPSDVLLVDDFSAPQSPDMNTAGGTNTITNLEIESCSAGRCNEPPPAQWFHDRSTFTGKIAWPQSSGGGTPQLTMRLAPGGEAVDVSKFPMLVFRVAAQFSTRNPNSPTSQNFSVRLMDAAGATSNSIAAGDLRPIGYPTGAFFRRSVLRSMRVPLSDFRGVNAARITAVQFVFDKQREGAIFLTDVHFSPK